MTRATVIMTIDDAEHYTPEERTSIVASYMPYEREARAKGIPVLGSGAIYPVPEDDITIADFPIPDHWPRCYALDVGWNKTAAVWGAIDREDNTVYLYSEHYRGQAEPVVHTEAIKSRGSWIPGVIDPAARGRGQKDGDQLIKIYKDLGLDISPANNAVEAGIHAVWMRLSGGKLKVFKSLQNWLEEFRLYRRDKDGRIVKERDHLMDTTRYLIMSGLDRATVKMPDKFIQNEPTNYFGVSF